MTVTDRGGDLGWEHDLLVDEQPQKSTLLTAPKNVQMRVYLAIFSAYAVALGLPLSAHQGLCLIAIAPYVGASMLLLYFALGMFLFSRLCGLSALILCTLIFAKTASAGELSALYQAVALVTLIGIGQGVMILFQYHNPESRMSTKLKRLNGCGTLIVLSIVLLWGVLAQVEMRLVYDDLSTNPVVEKNVGKLEKMSLDWFYLRKDRRFRVFLTGSESNGVADLERNARRTGPRYVGVLKLSDGKTYDLEPTLRVP